MARNYKFRSSVEMRRDCVVEIIEQPASKLQRFRYASEVDGSRSVGSIPGVHSTGDRKTYPTIRVHGYSGPMVVMLSLVNPDDNLVHPHAITGNDARYHCTNGVITTFVDGPEVVFNNVGILCVKSKTEEDVTAAVRHRQTLNIDPFKAGFPHIDDHRLINFNAVRLCFTVYIPEGEILPQDRENINKYNIDLKPVASNIVYDAKKISELKIQYINKYVGSMQGGTEIVILCDKYTGANPEVVFVEGEKWEEKAEIKMYHKQMAVVAISPPYWNPLCTQNVPVEVYLQRKNARGVLERSAPASSEYIPAPPKSHPSEVGMKRPPPDYIKSKIIKKPFKEHLTQYIKTTDAQRNVEMERAIAQLVKYFEPSPSDGSNYQDAGRAASNFSNTPVQQADMYWPHHSTFETSNPFSQQIDSIVDHAASNFYRDINTSTHTYNQTMDTASPSIPYVNTLDPIMPNMQNFAQPEHNEPPYFNTNYNNVLVNNVTMLTEFSTHLPQDGESMSFVNTLNPMPNIIPTASTSFNEMPDVLLSPMSEESLSVNTDTKFDAAAVGVDHFNIFNENGVVDLEYENMQNNETLKGDTGDFPANLESYEYVTENLSDEFKKITSF